MHLAISVVTQTGYQHFMLSNDTRLKMDARRAHRFVALNCEEISKNIMRLAGASAAEIEEALKDHAAECHAFNQRMQASKVELAK